MMDKHFVIIGEASESEDEEKVVLNLIQSKKSVSALGIPQTKGVGLIVAGEASESDSESEETFREAFFARSGATENAVDDDVQNPSQYDSLLHKKLRECNQSLYNNMVSFTRGNLSNTIRAVNSTNQQLLVSQIQIQDAASALAKAFDNLAKLSGNLDALLATDYIPEISIT